ncbi:MAG TPA: MEDS domain-containing protein [Thermoanaerobaculia bacterium]
MTGQLRRSGIPPVGGMPWGTHFCLFFETAADLLETSIPYFVAGLEQRELCFWLYSEPLTEASITEAFERAMPGYASYRERGAIVLQPARAWYYREGVLDWPGLRAAWEKLTQESRQKGFAGLRIAGCNTWLEEEQWDTFQQYEQDFDDAASGMQMIVLCAYPLATTGAAGILDVAHSHELAIAKRKGVWDMVETPALRLKQLAQRNRQQFTIAELGQTAIRARELDTLLNEAATCAAETLGTGRSILWEVQPEQNCMFLRASAGWPELPLGATVPLEDASPALRAVQQDRPLVIADVANDTRFTKSWVLRNYGVASVLAAVIRGRERPWGLLSVHSMTPRTFSDDDTEFLQSMANVVALAIERDEHERAERGKEDERVRLLARMEALSRRLLLAQEEERRRLSIELHDQLGQILTAVKINIGSAPPRLGDAMENIDQAMQSVRDLALELRPSVLDDLGLGAALRSHADRFAQQAGLELHLSVEEIPRLDPPVATACFRVAQEALTNVARHASAKNVWLELHRASDAVELIVRDDGLGFDLDAASDRAVRGASLGLIGMQERVSFAAGALAIRTAPGRGTEVCARFPLRGAA